MSYVNPNDKHLQKVLANECLQNHRVLIDAYEWEDGEVARVGISSSGSMFWVFGEGDQQVVIVESLSSVNPYSKFKLMKGDVRKKLAKILGFCWSSYSPWDKSGSLGISGSGPNDVVFPTFVSDEFFERPTSILIEMIEKAQRGQYCRHKIPSLGTLKIEKKQMGRKLFLYKLISQSKVISGEDVHLQGTSLDALLLELFERRSIYPASKRRLWMANKENINIGKFIPDGELFEAMRETHPMASFGPEAQKRWDRRTGLGPGIRLRRIRSRHGVGRPLRVARPRDEGLARAL